MICFDIFGANDFFQMTDDISQNLISISAVNKKS